MAINVPSKEFYLHSLIVGFVFFMSLFYFSSQPNRKNFVQTVLEFQNKNGSVYEYQLPIVFLNGKELYDNGCQVTFDLTQKVICGNETENVKFLVNLKKPETGLEQFKLLSLKLLGKTDSNFILLNFAIFSYLIGLVFSLLSMELMNALFLFNRKSLEESVYPFGLEGKRISLTFDSEKHVTYMGSAIYYDLSNFLFSVGLVVAMSIFVAFLPLSYVELLFFLSIPLVLLYLAHLLLDISEVAIISASFLILLLLLVFRFTYEYVLLILLILISSIFLRIQANYLVYQAIAKENNQDENN